jgi:hypothetical protein
VPPVDESARPHIEATLDSQMESSLDRRRSQVPVPQAPLGRRRHSGAPDAIWFVPARWLVVAFAIARLLLTKGAFAKIGVVGLLWSLAPRKLKVVTAGLAAAWAIVIAGSLAAIALLALQLS